jgi:hypothetical protein
MDRIDAILEDYERDLERAKEGRCKEISWCTDFRDAFRKTYHQMYKAKLEVVKAKLTKRGHKASIEEKSEEEIFYGFSFSLIPRHLLTGPIDRFYPSSLQSSITFQANEHTLTVDVGTAIRPTIDELESNKIEKIPRNEFTEARLLEAIGEFLEKAFNETIVLDFKSSR